MVKQKLPFPDFHPEVNSVSKSLYETWHFTDALRKASIRLEEVCKKILKNKTWKEETWTTLMAKLFCEKDWKVIFPLVNLWLQDSWAKQQSYYFLFSWFAWTIRNTLAHNSDDLDDIEALYWLNIVSYLFYKLDRAIEINSIDDSLDEEVIKKEKVKVISSKSKKDLENQLEQILIIDERINKISSDTNDKTLAKLSIEKIANEILTEKIDEIWEEVFNYYFENEEKINFIILQKIYDNSSN